MANIVITGGSSGIGAALVRHFVNQGDTVYSLSRSTGVDISNHRQVCLAFEDIQRVDVLINNAGIFKLQTFTNMTAHDITQVIQVNLLGALYVSQQAVRKGAKRIINISSVSALAGIQNQSVYSASKAGLNAWAQSVAQEGINITTLNLGGIDTPMAPFEGQHLSTQEVVKTVQYLMQLPTHAVVKELTLFPQSEWHP